MSVSQNQTYLSIVSGSRDIRENILSLNPSSLIELFEIDFSEVHPITKTLSYGNDQPTNMGILRIYNNFNLFKMTNNPYGIINWRNNSYYPFPIKADGFEYNSSTTLPTPKISISNSSPDRSNNSFYNYLRMQFQSFDDIIGAKFTRIRTFLKYLNSSNFEEGYNIYATNTGIYEIELPKDVYYIDRKTMENSSIIEYQLNTILDLENLVFPGRTIYSKKCPFQYRGEGCCYEYDNRLTSLHSGIYADTINPSISVKGLLTAPPVATENNQLFIGEIFPTGQIGASAIHRITGSNQGNNGPLGNSGAWNINNTYISGDFVFLENRNLKNYFVCIKNHTSNAFDTPLNKNYWIPDVCAKDIGSCRLRWLKNPAFRPIIWPVNRGGENFNATASRIYWTYYGNESLFVTGVNGKAVNFPRRPGAEDPSSPEAHGIPKDANGNYLNGFLPFGGFPGTNKPNV
jgi:lambda family phage minor tail protein L